MFAGGLPSHWREIITTAVMSDLSSEKADEIDTIFDQMTVALKKVELISTATGKPKRKYKKRAPKSDFLPHHMTPTNKSMENSDN